MLLLIYQLKQARAQKLDLFVILFILTFSDCIFKIVGFDKKNIIINSRFYRCLIFCLNTPKMIIMVIFSIIYFQKNVYGYWYLVLIIFNLFTDIFIINKICVYEIEFGLGIRGFNQNDQVEENRNRRSFSQLKNDVDRNIWTSAFNAIRSRDLEIIRQEINILEEGLLVLNDSPLSNETIERINLMRYLLVKLHKELCYFINLYSRLNILSLYLSQDDEDEDDEDDDEDDDDDVDVDESHLGLYISNVKIKDIFLDKEVDCLICLDKLEEEEDISRIGCGHFFHPKCLIEWIKKKNVCPICNQNIREAKNLHVEYVSIDIEGYGYYSADE